MCPQRSEQPESNTGIGTAPSARISSATANTEPGYFTSGHAAVNTAWMWGASIATSLAGWLHQLTATSPISGNPDTATEPDQAEPDQAEPERAIPLVGLGVAGGKAMIETLQHRVIRVPGRLIHHAGAPVLRLPHGDHLLAEVLARLRALPTRPS